MALTDVTYNITRPGSRNGGANIQELFVEQYTGIVEGTLERASKLTPWVPMRSVKGGATFSNWAVGESTLQKVVPGTTPDGTKNDFAKNSVTVDTVVLARSIFPMLEVFQEQFNVRQEVGQEHGTKLAKFIDQMLSIAAIKTSLLTESTFKGSSASGKPAGHYGASQEVLQSAADAQDPAKLYAALGRMFVKMENKDVDPDMDDEILMVSPEVYFTLSQNEMLVNKTYVTANGTNLDADVIKTYGVPVVKSVNFAMGKNISGHLYSNTQNGNYYDGDFSKVLATAFSQRAIMAGETIPLTTAVFWDEISKHHFVDAYLSSAAGSNRAEFAASLLLP